MTISSCGMSSESESSENTENIQNNTIEAQDEEETKGAHVKFSFKYTKQTGPGSNQFAIWIEDEMGNYIETVYATKFTAKGGWKIRDASIPTWVEKAKDILNKKEEVDLITSATPKPGDVSYIWDCTDKSGEPVEPGVYKFFFEASLRGYDRVVYSGDIEIGGDKQIAEVSEEFFGKDIAERSMIQDVKVEYLH